MRALYKLRYNELRAQCYLGEVWTAWALNLLAHDACLVLVQHSWNNQRTIVVHCMLKKWGRNEHHWKHIFQDLLTLVIKLILTARTPTYSCNFLPIFGIHNFSQLYQVSCPNVRLFIDWNFTTSILMERPNFFFSVCLTVQYVILYNASQLLFVWYLSRDPWDCYFITHLRKCFNPQALKAYENIANYDDNKVNFL